MNQLSPEDQQKINALLHDVGLRPLKPEDARRTLRKRGLSNELIEHYILQRSYAQQ